MSPEHQHMKKYFWLDSRRRGQCMSERPTFRIGQTVITPSPLAVQKLSMWMIHYIDSGRSLTEEKNRKPKPKCLHKLLSNHIDVVIVLWLRSWPTMHHLKRQINVFDLKWNHIIIQSGHGTVGATTSCFLLLRTDPVSLWQELHGASVQTDRWRLFSKIWHF